MTAHFVCTGKWTGNACNAVALAIVNMANTPVTNADGYVHQRKYDKLPSSHFVRTGNWTGIACNAVALDIVSTLRPTATSADGQVQNVRMNASAACARNARRMAYLSLAFASTTLVNSIASDAQEGAYANMG